MFHSGRIKVSFIDNIFFDYAKITVNDEEITGQKRKRIIEKIIAGKIRIKAMELIDCATDEYSKCGWEFYRLSRCQREYLKMLREVQGKHIPRLLRKGGEQ